MSEATRSQSLADQHIDLTSPEQTQLSIYPPWYPYDVSRTTLCSNYTNLLLVFVPIGIAAGALGWDPVAVFSLNFLAIIPLAPLIAFSTRELSASVGHVLGGLLKEALSNSVEIVVRHLCLSLMPCSTFFA
jgi:Ca2+:H+ antiporter